MKIYSKGLQGLSVLFI